MKNAHGVAPILINTETSLIVRVVNHVHSDADILYPTKEVSGTKQTAHTRNVTIARELLGNGKERVILAMRALNAMRVTSPFPNTYNIVINARDANTVNKSLPAAISVFRVTHQSLVLYVRANINNIVNPCTFVNSVLVVLHSLNAPLVSNIVRTAST